MSCRRRRPVPWFALCRAGKPRSHAPRDIPSQTVHRPGMTGFAANSAANHGTRHRNPRHEQDALASMAGTAMRHMGGTPMPPPTTGRGRLTVSPAACPARTPAFRLSPRDNAGSSLPASPAPAASQLMFCRGQALFAFARFAWRVELLPVARCPFPVASCLFPVACFF